MNVMIALRTRMLSGLSSQWSLTLAPMIWEWMGLCKSTLRSIPSCLFGTKRGYSCFHPITVKKKNSTSNYIFVIESLVPNQMPILEVFFDWRKRWAFLIPCPPAVSNCQADLSKHNLHKPQDANQRSEQIQERYQSKVASQGMYYSEIVFSFLFPS